MKASILLFLWLLFLFHTSCSNTAGVNKAATVNINIARAEENRNARNDSDQSAQTPENKSPRNPKDVVLFDGKNYIKKSGWKVPSRKDAYVNESYDGSPVQHTTKGGKGVYTTTLHYIYKTPWLYSQDFYYEGRDLDYLSGKLECRYFLETSANGKVFMYSISGKKIVSPPPPNSDDHEDPFIYQIQDNTGDGIFETLVHEDEIIVPNWVLK